MALVIVTGGTTGATNGTIAGTVGNPLVFAGQPLNTVVDVHLRTETGECDDLTFTVPTELQVSYDGGSTWKGIANNPSAAENIGPVNVAVKLRQVANAASASGTFTTDGTFGSGTAPSLTGTLTATPGVGQMALDWPDATDNVGVTGYDVQYKLASSGTWLDASDAVTSSATVTGITGGESYDFRVRAYDAAGLTSSWLTATATPSAGFTAGPTSANVARRGADITATFSASSAKVAVVLNGATPDWGTAATFTGTYAFTGVPGPSYDAYVRLYDSVGGVLTTSSAHTFTLAVPTLLAHWKMDETSGTAVNDETANNNDGTSSATIVTGLVSGKARAGEGTNYVTGGSGLSLSGKTSLYLDAYFRKDATTGDGNWQSLFHYYYNTSNSAVGGYTSYNPSLNNYHIATRLKTVSPTQDTGVVSTGYAITTSATYRIIVDWNGSTIELTVFELSGGVLIQRAQASATLSGGQLAADLRPLNLLADTSTTPAYKAYFTVDELKVG